MSVSMLFLSEKLMTDFTITPPRLKEQALIKLAIQICLKSKLNEDIIPKSVDLDRCVEHKWEYTIKQRSIAIIETLPLSLILKGQLVFHIRLIAVQLLSWIRQHEKILPISTKLMNQFLIPSDWTVEGRLDERKIADRLVKDKRFPVYQRYQLACVYCLEPSIVSLWNCLKPDDKEHFILIQNEYFSRESQLVKLWSRRLSGIEPTSYNLPFWQYALHVAAHNGIAATVVYCWNLLSLDMREDIINRCSEIPLFQINFQAYSWIYCLLAGDVHQFLSPFNCNYIFLFLLSQMSVTQKTIYLKKINNKKNAVFESLLYWPFQDFLIEIINSLWDVLSESNYCDLLLKISMKYAKSGIQDLKIKVPDYDYGGLLVELVKKAPEHYKRCVFRSGIKADMHFSCVLRSGINSYFYDILSNLCENIENRDINVIRNFLSHATAEEKQIFLDSRYGKDIFYNVFKTENWKLADIVLEACLPKEHIFTFKKQFLLSEGYLVYFDLLQRHNEYPDTNMLLHWGFSSAEDETQFRCKAIFELQNRISDFIYLFKTGSLDKIIHICFPSKEVCEHYKQQCIEKMKIEVCYQFIEDSEWEELSQFLNWCFKSIKDREKFKQEFFVKKGKQVCDYFLPCSEEQWENAERFFKWCNLSPKSIKKLKKETILSVTVLDEIYAYLIHGYFNEDVVHYLERCLATVNDVMTFKQKFEEVKMAAVFNSSDIAFKQRIIQKWNFLIRHRLHEAEVSDDDDEQEDTESIPHKKYKSLSR